MPSYQRILLSALLLSLGFLHLPAQTEQEREPTDLAPALDSPEPEVTDGPVIKLALLLDTSNSMDGLINQARSRIWNIVNEMGKARVDGQLPQLQVALFHYGNDRLSKKTDFVELRCPFTTDLDIVSEQLFGLSTNGGSEFCGAVISEAVQRLDWGQTRDGPALRVVVIAGNEPFNQGTEPYVESITRAQGLDIRVNTLFCGDKNAGRNTLWADGAKLGKGYYAAIDQNEVIEEIDTPFDDAIFRLNKTLDGTYLGYGQKGKKALRRQAEQDSFNEELSFSAGLSRANVKASANYEAASWDLVSAHENGSVDLDELEDKDLPDELLKLSGEKRKEQLELLAEERKKSAAEIQELSLKRTAFIAETRRGAAETGQALDDALIGALREQAQSLGFVFSD